MRTWMFPVVAALLMSNSPTAVKKLCRGIMPKNDLSIPEGDIHANKISKAGFDAVLDRLEKIYSPLIAAKGGTFVIERRWKDPTVNAYADRDDQGNWMIHMFGGLARHPLLTNDGFALVACHEIGHQLGGAPKMIDEDGAPNWAAVEGEADYYATLKCLRRYFERDDNDVILKKMKLNPSAVITCQAEHGSKIDQQFCERSTMAGISMAKVLALLEHKAYPSLDTPDGHVVVQTDPDHPASQCRLDTYYNGALCRVPVAQALSETDYHPGSCADPNAYVHGLRPECWFAP